MTGPEYQLLDQAHVDFDKPEKSINFKRWKIKKG